MSVPGDAGVLLGGQPGRTGRDLALLVVGVAGKARGQAQATAADAAGQLALEPVEVGDLLVDARRPVSGDALPVRLVRRTPAGQGLERVPDLVEAETHALSRPDERHATEHVAGIPALVAAGALGLEQPDLLVEPQRGCRHTRPRGQLADRQVVRHPRHAGLLFLLLEGVLDLLARLLQVGLGLVALTLCLQAVVTGRVANLLLGLAA